MKKEGIQRIQEYLKESFAFEKPPQGFERFNQEISSEIQHDPKIETDLVRERIRNKEMDMDR